MEEHIQVIEKIFLKSLPLKLQDLKEPVRDHDKFVLTFPDIEDNRAVRYMLHLRADFFSHNVHFLSHLILPVSSFL